MPTYLNDFMTKLLSRLDRLEKAFERHALSPTLNKRVDKYALQEGLISSLWQSWCEFCRDVVISTTTGASTRAGNTVISPIYSIHTEAEIAFIAAILSKSERFNTIKPIKSRRHEPTWGDIDKLLLIITGLSPTNTGSLLSIFGSANAIKDLQVYRNASAHVCSDTIKSVSATRLRYNDTKFMHPSDTMFWIDPISRNYLWKLWIDEMELISDFATQ
jgi:hypothetical protein